MISDGVISMGVGKEYVIEQTELFVKEALKGQSSDHDWVHSDCVRRVGMSIGRVEGADLYIVELTGLLHDVDDWKFNKTGEPIRARQHLEGLNVEQEIIEHVCEIISTMSFKGINAARQDMRTIEGKVVQDADRLDAIGARGIARAFTYGGHKGRRIYDPDIMPVMHDSFEAYKDAEGTTLNHFYEKLLHLSSMMNTETAKMIAERRHQVIMDYLAQFHAELEGRA